VPSSNFITVYIQKDETARFDRLTRIAAKRGLSRSGMVREAMGLWEAKYAKPERKPATKKPAKRKAKKRATKRAS
jgi:hypothetical protein